VLDHTGVNVSDYQKSREFYARALGAIGYQVLMEFPMDDGKGHVAGFGEPPKPDFWIASGAPNKPCIHIAFRVGSRKLVDAFHAAGMAAGGRDNGKPGVREHYHPNYYGAFVLDPDGHNIEAVCHDPP
jgi:catechol 2,3-dioxygenase-like lactoylglutathione lyase family enzyme